MSKYWSEVVKNIEPYVPGEQPKDKKYIKLNTNENPYPPSPRVLEAIQRAAGESLKLYPDPNSTELVEVISDYYQLKKEQVFVGNGSDEVLAFSFMAFFDNGQPVLFPDITYTFYPVYSQLFEIKYVSVPLDDMFGIPEELFYRENGGIIISNPKSPTGQYFPLDAIERILQRNMDRVVIVDEAYIDFGGESAVPLIEKYPNLLVIHTLSKSRSLAGLRVGYALGQEDLIQGLNRIKNSFNSYTLDRLAIAGAAEAFRDREYFRETTGKVIATRERITTELRALDFQVIDSKANFIFISHPRVSAKTIFTELREKGVLVRYFNKPRIDNFLRMSIGSDQEMEYVMEVLRGILRNFCRNSGNQSVIIK